MPKPTIEQVFEFIRIDNQYQSSSTVRSNPNQYNPYNPTEQLLNSMLLAEKFVETVGSSEKMPFKFVKTLKGTRLKNTKTGLIDRLFYELLESQLEQQYSSVPPKRFGVFPHYNNTNGSNQDKYEESENLKALCDVASELELNIARFFYDPMAPIGEGWILEGELINTFVELLRETMKKEGFKKRVVERKNEVKQNLAITKRYIERLQEYHPHLYAQSIVLCYQGEHVGKINLKQSDNYLQKYLTALKAYLPADCLIGWWWKREYQTEMGHRYYLIFFCDSRSKPFDQLAVQNTYGPYWRHITDEQGDCFLPAAINNWQLNFGTADFEYGLAGLMFRIQSLLMRDIFFRLKISQKIDRFGMGEMPSLIHGMPPNKLAATNY